MKETGKEKEKGRTLRVLRLQPDVLQQGVCGKRYK